MIIKYLVLYVYDNDHMKTLLPADLIELLPNGLLDSCQLSEMQKGARLFTEGKPPRYLFYVKEGEVALIRHGAQGETAIMQRQRRGFIGEASLMSERYHCNAYALQKSSLIKIPITIHIDFLTKDSEFSLRWIKMLSHELRRTRLNNERLSLPTVQARLLHFLNTESTNGAFDMQGSVKSLAQELAVTYEALYRCLSALEKKGMIIRSDRMIKLVPR